MEQTSREIVRKTLTFNTPQRIARQTWMLPWALNNFPEEIKRLKELYPDDIVTAPDVYQPSMLVTGEQYEVGSYVDEWGCRFENIHKGIIGEVKEPVITDLKDLSLLHAPYEILPQDKDAARVKVNDFCTSSSQFVIANCCARPWERLQFLCGTATAMMDIITPGSGAKELVAAIHKFYIEELKFWVSTDVDAVMFMDDWGSQNSLLIPPPVWREVFKPLYKDYCDIAHNNDKFIFMHSDGHITAIYPDLVEIGVDAVNSQLFCMDMAEIASIAKGKITFWGEIDRQHVMPALDTKQAEQAVEEVAKLLYSPEGGIIAQFEISPGSNIQNAFAIHKQWQKIGTEKRT
jgi:uroporphyrinogen decarboxylase